jgi:CRISPR/Cas system-associated protein Cas5 (RAMP superfamily)
VKNNRRIKHIAGGCDEGDENIGEIYDDHDDFENLASDEKCKQILKLLKTIGYKINKDGIVKDIVSKEKLDEVKEKIVEIVDEKFKVLFKMKKCDINYVENKLGRNEKTNIKFLKTLNGFLENYGYEMKAINKCKKVKCKVIKTKYYKLCDNIIVKLKYDTV